MKFLLLVVLVPILLVPLAAVGIQVTLCEMHVTAVDGMRDKKASTERQGPFYSYCNFMAAALRRII
jgi:hypothetical protein